MSHACMLGREMIVINFKSIFITTRKNVKKCAIGRRDKNTHVLQWWVDPNLAWNESQYGDIEMISMFRQDIWFPSITSSDK
jgi:hypothetical protein